MIYLQLSLMMFLQYAVWGAWLPLAARFLRAAPTEGGLGFTDTQIGWILGLAGSLGAISAPFIAGQLADRKLRAEYCLAVLLTIGGVVKWYTAFQTEFMPWLSLSIVYSILYMPTLSLSNSLAFAHLKAAGGDFARVRVWGTIGWIAASWVFPMIWLQHDLVFRAMPPFFTGPEVENVTGRLVDSMKFSGILSWIYAAYCLMLPATPPKSEAQEELAFMKAFALFSRPSFLVLALVGLIIAAIHQVYFLQTGPFFSHLGLRDSDIGPAMTIGQFSEIIMMAFLGFFLRSLGFRGVMLLGCLAYLARYAIWGTTSLPASVMVVSQLLHGLCYACYFAAAYIYVDRLADADVRHSAQTVFGIVTLGGGPVFGGMLSGALGAYASRSGTMDYATFWYTLAGIGLISTVILALFFRDETKAPQTADEKGVRDAFDHTGFDVDGDGRRSGARSTK